MSLLGLILVINTDKAVIGQYQLMILTNQYIKLGSNLYGIKQVHEDYFQLSFVCVFMQMLTLRLWFAGFTILLGILQCGTRTGLGLDFVPTHQGLGLVSVSIDSGLGHYLV